MAKWLSDFVLDGSLERAAVCNQLTVCEGQPTTYEEANNTIGTGAGKVIARFTVAAGDFTIGDGTPNGRTITVAGQSGAIAEAGGTGDHIALTLTTDQTLRATNIDSTPTAIVAGATVNTGQFTWNTTDPT